MSFTRLLGPVLALAAPACHSDDVVVGGGPIEVTQFSVVTNRALDLLFVIDNSPSMREKQIALANAFPRLLDVLAGIDGGLPDLHIGVVTSDMGTTSAASGEPTAGVGQPGNGGCAGRGDDGALRHIDGMAARFLSTALAPDGTRVTNYTGELRDMLGALTQVGAGGCGFEQHLRAMQRAVENPLNVGFLRPDANLAVVILADEDDCSARTGALFGPEAEALGPLTSFRCFAHGVSCDEGVTTVGAKSGCRPDDASDIIAGVAPFVDALVAGRTTPRRVRVGARTGHPGRVGRERPGDVALRRRARRSARPDREASPGADRQLVLRHHRPPRRVGHRAGGAADLRGHRRSRRGNAIDVDPRVRGRRHRLLRAGGRSATVRSDARSSGGPAPDPRRPGRRHLGLGALRARDEVVTQSGVRRNQHNLLWTTARDPAPAAHVGRPSVFDRRDALRREPREAVLHRLDLRGRVALPGGELAEDSQRRARAIGPRRVARELLVGEVRVILDRPGRLDDVDPPRPVADRELGAPRRGVERGGQVHERRGPSLTVVRGAPHLDRVTGRQGGLGAVEVARRPCAVGPHDEWHGRRHRGTTTRGSGRFAVRPSPVVRPRSRRHAHGTT